MRKWGKDGEKQAAECKEGHSDANEIRDKEIPVDRKQGELMKGGEEYWDRHRGCSKSDTKILYHQSMRPFPGLIGKTMFLHKVYIEHF